MSNVFYVTQPVFSSGTVTVTIMADAGADVGSVDYTISYDSTEAAYDNTTGPSGWLTVPNGKTAGSVVVSEAGTTGVAISSAQTIGTVTFTPVAGASVLSLSVTITDWATEDGIEDSNHYNLGSSIVQLDTVYALAAPILPTTTLTFGAARVSNSATLTQTLPIENGTTANPLQESLLYSIAAATPFSVASGGSGTIVAGSTATPTLSLSEATSGDFNGSTISVGLTSMGTSGLANMPLTSQTVTLDGAIFAPAVPALSTTSVNFGAVHVGGTVSSTVTITNGASGALTDVLTGGFGTIASPFTGSGNLGAGIAAGSSGTLTVGWTATSAGVSSGFAALSLDSHDTILPDVTVAAGQISLTGTGYAYAAPILPTATLNLGAARVGSGTLTQTLPVENGTTASAYQESVLYAIVTPPTPFSVSSGGSGTIVSGASATPVLALSETTSGSFAATGTVDLTSTGTGTSGLGNTPLTAQTVAVTGEIFATATAQPNTTSVNFGVVHAGQTVTPVSLGITNTATGALTDLLTAGNNTDTGSYNGTVTDSLGSGLAAGASGTVNFGIVTSSSGTQAGTVDLGFFSHDATLSDVGLASASITVTGTVDNYATAAVEKISGAGTLTSTGTSTYTLNLGTVVVGATAPTAVLEAENAATGLADLMQGSFALAGTTLGTFSGLGAGQAGTATPVTVSLPTGTVGSFTETVTMFASGTNASTYLGPLTPEVVTVTGSVGPIAPAVATIVSGTSVAFGVVHLASLANETISIRNGATAPAAGLDTSVAGVTGSATSSGSISLLAAGTTDSTDMLVGINTGTVGVVNGTATFDFVSDAGSGQTTTLAPQQVAVSGTVFAYATAILSAATLAFQAARVGGSAPTQTLTIHNGTTVTTFQDSLGYSIAATSPFNPLSGGSGTIAPGGSATPTLALSTATSGNFSASATVGLTTTDGVPGYSGVLTAQTVALTGEIFATATAQPNTTSVNFGVVHAGQTVTPVSLGITNTATGALTDLLTAGVNSNSGSYTGTVTDSLGSGLTAGTSGTVSFAIVTTSSGVQTGTADLGFVSHDATLADLPLTPVAVTVTGTVDNYATAALGLDGGAGAFTPGGTVDTLNLGTVAVGSAAPTADLEAINAATGLADLLQGSFVVAGTTGFTNIGFAPFGSLAAGLADTVGTVSLSTGTAGSFTETVTLFASGTNASGYLGTLTPDILTITGSVVGPPPGTGTYVWTGATGTNAGTAANWDDVTASQNPAATSPGTTDTAEFLNNSGTITGTLAVAAAQFGSSGLWALNSGAMLSAATSVSVGNGVVALSGGASISGTGTGDVISGTSGLSASVQLSGAGTQWNDTGSLIVGDKGLGSLLIVAGATATTMVLPTAAAPPTLSINNAGRLGGSGKASANIASSGTVFAASGTYEVQGSVTGSGVLEIDAGAELKLDGAVGTGQTVAFVGSDGTVSIAQLGSFTPATITGFTAGDEVLLPDLAYVNPSYNATTGKLTLRDNEGNTIDTLTFAGAPSATTVLNALVLPTGAVIGNQAGSDGSSVTVSGAGSQWNVTGQLDVGDAAAGALTIVNGATVSASQLVAGLQSGGSGNINVEDTGSKLSVVNNVTLGANGVGVLTLGQGTTLSVVNVLDVGKFGVVSQFNATIDPNYYYVAGVSGGSGSLPVGILIGNTGTIFASNGTETVTAPTINGALVSGGTGTGVLEIDSGGDLVLNAGTIDSSQTVNFAAGGTNEVLTIGMAGTTSGTVTTPGTVPAIIGFNPAAINGFAAGDTIVVDTTAAATFGLAGSVVSVIDIGTGGTLGVLTFAAAAQASLAYDTSGALVDVPCFAAGTLIETDRGPVAVEALREGDHVVTAEDARLEPIVWIGRRTVNCRVHPKPEQVWPVRVKKGAFGVRMPVRDLYLSPDHAVFVNDVLVPVKCLINGTSITQVKRHAVTYYHVELPRHELILAEGLAVESYLDVGDRSDFENGGGVVTLFPNFTCLKWETEGCAQLVVTGPELEAARAVVDARAASVRRQARSAPEPDARPVPRAHRKQPSKAVQAA